MRAENGSRTSLYGATNPGFIADISPQKDVTNSSYSTEPTGKKILNNEEMVQERPEDERENWDSKLTFLLATIGY